MTIPPRARENPIAGIALAPRATILGVCILLVAITWLVFGETLSHPFINLDDGAKAVDLARNVLDHAGYANAMVLRTLAAGYAESGRFSEAIATAQQALQLASAQGNAALIEDLQINIANYRMNLPLRDPGAWKRTPAPESGIQK